MLLSKADGCAVTPSQVPAREPLWQVCAVPVVHFW